MQRHKHSCHHSRNRKHNRWWIDDEKRWTLAYFAYLDLLGELGSYRFCIWCGEGAGDASNLPRHHSPFLIALAPYVSSIRDIESPKRSRISRCNGIFAKFESSRPMSAAAVVPFPESLLLMWSSLFPVLHSSMGELGGTQLTSRGP